MKSIIEHKVVLVRNTKRVSVPTSTTINRNSGTTFNLINQLTNKVTTLEIEVAD
jgi:hypothetical protein